MDRPIRIALVGAGNCASSLVQGLHYYTKNPDAPGLAHPRLGGYGVSDIEVVAAFDVDARKVNRPLHDALLAPPNNTTIFHPLPPGGGAVVRVGPVLDGVAAHTLDHPVERRVVPTDLPPVDVVKVLRDSGAMVMVNYLPVGAQRASEYYAACCLDAGVAMVNCIPVFIASDPGWASRFADARLPIVGDDIKAQVGATITHRTLARLFEQRGAVIDHTYQLNVGGNTDFLNMLDRSRLASKKISKTDAVNSQIHTPLPPGDIHVGPSDYVPFLQDNKVCFIRIEARGFGGVPLSLELRLSVEDSPNSAGSAIDAIRCAAVALDRRLAGPIDPVCAWTMKHPPRQLDDQTARREMLEWCAAADQHRV